MHSMMRRLPLRIFNCQQFPSLLNFNFRRQFGLFQYLVKLPAGNGNVTNLQHRLLQKQTAYSYSTIPAATETLEYKHGKAPRLLNIECIEGKNDEKYIGLTIQMGFNKIRFPNISLPDDGYSLVKAMDTMMSKFPDEEKPPIFYEFVKSSHFDCEYKLEIYTYKGGQLEFSMEIIKNMENASSNRLGLIFFPVSLLPELRDRMAKMLTKFDGTQQCEPCSSPFPEWIKANQVQDEEPLPRVYRSESLKYSIDPDKPADCWRIKIEFVRGVSGKKFIGIQQRHDNDKPRLNAKNVDKECIYNGFPNILVPEDGYKLLSGMIDLSNDFKKMGNLPIQRNNQQSSLICRQIVKGIMYDYKLEIHSRNDQQQLEFQMKTITNDGAPSHKPKKLFVPIHIFDWLQAQMAYSLAADLDTEEYEDKEKNPAEDKSIPSSNN